MLSWDWGVLLLCCQGKRDLITTGPYAVVRHPAYFGESLMLLACVFSSPNFVAVLLGGLALLSVAVRILCRRRVLGRGVCLIPSGSSMAIDSQSLVIVYVGFLDSSLALATPAKNPNRWPSQEMPCSVGRTPRPFPHKESPQPVRWRFLLMERSKNTNG